MKKTVFIISAAFFLFGFSVMIYTEHTVKSVLKQINLTEDEAQEYMFSNIARSSFYIPLTNELKQFAVADRPAIITLAGKYLKEYTKTPEFLEKYKEYKESLKPSPPDPPQSVDDLKKQQRAALEEGIKNMEDTKKLMPADQQPIFDENIASFKQQLKELDNPDNPMFSPEMDENMKKGYEMQLESHKKQLEELENEYPESPAPMIKQWLTKFLEETSDIDFSAKLAEERGRKVFVNSAYEYKSHFWKLCFRSGKETTDAARSFAQSWLNELK